ncbi:MAG: inositol monophosphatase [Ruminococcaceae bacterium]|nr:inositol monophosphatase [Oscillospiraceae bacterium]
MKNITDYSSLLESVIALVKEAAELARKTELSVIEKGAPENIVTESDLAVQRFLHERLGELLPRSAFFCEEEGLCENSGECVWIIDPIDGTANYSRGIHESAISVALVVGKEARLGVVYNIFTGDIFSAVRGGGAFLNGKKITVSKRSFREGLFCTAMCVYKKELAALCRDVIYDAYMECNDLRRFGGCALELCYIAAGRCELFFEMRVFPWDYAAAYLILSEAGGVLYGFDGEELDFSKTTMLVGANNRENYEKLAGIVKKHIKSLPYED